MQLLRYIVHQLSPWGTPLRSDTLCGIVLTRLAERSGPEACQAAIKSFRAGEPPFILSSLLPVDSVFMPRLPSPPRALFRKWVEEKAFLDAQGKPLTLFSALELFKKFRKELYLPLEVWQRHAGSLSLKPLFAWFCQNTTKTESVSEKKDMAVNVEPHVTIDRIHGSTLAGGLFFTRQTWYPADRGFHLYAYAADPALLLELLQEVGDFGFGSDASTGKGRFSVQEDKDFDGSALEKAGPHSLLCSVCAAPSMAGLDGWYSLEAKRGKAGPAVSTPHKATLLLVQEGSVLCRLPDGPYVLEGVNADTRIVQITQPFVFSCSLSEEVHHA